MGIRLLFILHKLIIFFFIPLQIENVMQEGNRQQFDSDWSEHIKNFDWMGRTKLFDKTIKSDQVRLTFHQFINFQSKDAFSICHLIVKKHSTNHYFNFFLSL